MKKKKLQKLKEKHVKFIFFNLKDSEVVLKGSPVCLVGQNINFYMGGSKDIWKKSGTQVGIEVRDENNKLDQAMSKNFSNDLIANEQSYNDKKLEFFTYSSGLKLGLEKVFNGLADKVYQGLGPMLIKFKETPERVISYIFKIFFIFL